MWFYSADFIGLEVVREVHFADIEFFYLFTLSIYFPFFLVVLVQIKVKIPSRVICKVMLNYFLYLPTRLYSNKPKQKKGSDECLYRIAHKANNFYGTEKKSCGKPKWSEKAAFNRSPPPPQADDTFRDAFSDSLSFIG